ncbi:hypothetical protein ES288_A03G263400v1, partial [Gossypium darwinii]
VSLSLSRSPCFVFFFFLISSGFITNPQIYLFNPNLLPFLYRFSLSRSLLNFFPLIFLALRNQRPKHTHTLHCFLWFLKSPASSRTDFEWVYFSAVSLLRFL